MQRRVVITLLAGGLVAAGLLPALASDGVPPSPKRVDAPAVQPEVSKQVVPDARPKVAEASDPAPAKDRPAAESSDRPERLMMGCRAVFDAERKGIACRWSRSEHPAFAAYQLWRGDGHTRQVIFRTEDQNLTHYFDADVRPGHTYVYKVEAVNGGGHVIGEGGPVKVQAPGLEHLRMACKGLVDGDRSGIACRWSPSQHPRFAAYRLWRGDGDQRLVVFRTDDRNLTHYFDTDVQPGHTYVYKVEVLNADGDVIGGGGPVKAQAPIVRDAEPKDAEEAPAR